VGASQPMQPFDWAPYLRLDGTQLDLRGVDVSAQAFARSDPARWPRVRSVLLAGTAVDDDSLIALAGLPLTQLDLARTPVTDQGLRAIASLPLERLDLTQTAVTDAGLASLRAMPLRILVLRNTRVTAEGFDALESLALRLLDLSRSPVTARGLAALAHLQRLESLDLSNTSVNDAELLQLRSVVGLQVVYASQTAVSRSGIDALQRAKPGVRVVDTAATR